MRHGQPAVENGRIDLPEVDGVPRIAVFEMNQIGINAVQAGFHRPAEQEDRRRGAVVRAAAAVFAQVPAELGEDENQHPFRFARFLKVVQEGQERHRKMRMSCECC